MEATRRNLQAQPKILKKCWNTKSTNQNENFPKKSMFSSLKVKRNQKFVWELPDGICRLNPKSLKNVGTPNQPIRTKMFPTKVCLVP
jgi:hypothetical protein